MKVNSIKNRRGFTVVELVVAITIIVIVSATAIGLINTQNKIHQQTMQTVEATNMAENAIECFRWANSISEFETAYEKTFNGKITIEGNTENGLTDYIFEKNGMTVTIEIATKTEENAKTLYTLTFNAVANGNTILTKSYTK